MRLENWWAQAVCEDVCIVWGDIYQDYMFRFRNGEHIHTSGVMVAANSLEEGMSAYTTSGNLYILGKKGDLPYPENLTKPAIGFSNIEKAAMFADKAHEGQLRKYTGEKYISHPMGVAMLVYGRAEYVTRNMLQAAVLHDVLEDTSVTEEELLQAFGKEVTDLVVMLTDVSTPEDGNRSKRKLIDRLHLAGISPEAKTIKLADLIHNTKSIVEHAPDFAKTYMLEKKKLLEVLTEGDSTLWDMANKIVEEYYATVK